MFDVTIIIATCLWCLDHTNDVRYVCEGNIREVTYMFEAISRAIQMEIYTSYRYIHTMHIFNTD
jgi:hypothetical protein